MNDIRTFLTQHPVIFLKKIKDNSQPTAGQTKKNPTTYFEQKLKNFGKKSDLIFFFLQGISPLKIFIRDFPLK